MSTVANVKPHTEKVHKHGLSKWTGWVQVRYLWCRGGRDATFYRNTGRQHVADRSDRSRGALRVTQPNATPTATRSNTK